MIEHYISCFEITHGENGFHPHYHVLLFVPYSVGIGSHIGMEEDMYAVWKDCCTKSGLDEPSKNMDYTYKQEMKLVTMFLNGA